MEGQYNKRSPAVKRLMREAEELSQATSDYFAQPLEDNLFEWHFTVRGPSDTDFQGGIYHGRIILPADYPMKPPNIIILTPNGRFEVGKKICLSISGHHPESWQPSWSIRTALLAIIGFMPTPGQGTIGSLDYSSDERKKLARKSNGFVCDDCGSINILLKEESQDKPEKENTAEMEEIIKKMTFKSEEESKSESSKSTKDSNSDKKEDNDEKYKNLSEEDKAIKEASKAAQQRFRERLKNRTSGMAKQLANVESFGGGNRVNNPSQNRTTVANPGGSPPSLRNNRNNEPFGAGRSTLYDILIIIIVAAIAALVYRRWNLPDSTTMPPSPP